MRTLNELEDDLSEDISWRRTELQSLLSQIRAASGPSLSCLCRAGVALLYAHWEGYTKHALSQYLRYVARRRLKLSELDHCFAAIAVNARVAKIQGLSPAQQAVEVITSIRERQDERLHIPNSDGVDTQSNLNYQVCVDLLAGLGLDPSPFETKKALIDYSLLASRNKIAHGEYLDITKAGYAELHFEVLQMLGSIKLMTIDAAENKRYLKVAELGTAR